MINLVFACTPKTYQLSTQADDCIKQLKNLKHLLGKPNDDGAYTINWDIISLEPLNIGQYNQMELLLLAGLTPADSELKFKSYLVVNQQVETFKTCAVNNPDIGKKELTRYWGEPTFEAKKNQNIWYYSLIYPKFPNCPDLKAPGITQKYSYCNFINFRFSEQGLIEHMYANIECCFDQ